MKTLDVITEAAVLKALGVARENGLRTALDIDYRPNLWGLAGHGAGEERFIASAKVTEKLQSTLTNSPPGLKALRTRV